MPLPTPILDDRTFEQLVEEARARIPRFTPEWTNLNDSDPGMTLVKLHAWLTETILYRLNQLPDLNYIKFLELLNVEPRPAIPAQTQLTFTLKKLRDPADPLVVLIPKNTQVGVDDPDLEEELIFETDRTLIALNALLAAIITPSATADPLEFATEYDAKAVEVKIPRTFYPFGPSPAVGNVCLLGILLRPHRQAGKDYSLDRLPAGELDLAVFVPEVFEQDADGQEIIGPEGRECLFPWQVREEAETILWEAYTGTQHATQFPDVAGGSGWQRLNVMDETAGLTRSGHVYLDMPGGLPAIPFSELDRAFWSQLGLRRPPTNKQELKEDIDPATGSVDPEELADILEAMGLSDPVFNDPANPLSDQIDAATLNFAAVDVATWAETGFYDDSPVPFEIVWVRARLVELPEEPPQVTQMLLNTVGATAAVTRVEEIVGSSDGRPSQVHRLSRSPVLVDPQTGQPDLRLEVEELGEPEEWTAVKDFYGVTPDKAVYLLDPATGEIRFGDGEHGRIPVAGATIIARQYRYGGGRVGNAGANTITALKSALPEVDRVTNVRAASGGADVEPLSEVILRAPHDLRMRQRAVTADDFAELAAQTPCVRIHRANALALTRANLTTNPPMLVGGSPGAVTVVILPENKEETPQPTEDQLRLVCEHLDRARLITTELYVIGPRYVKVERLRAEVAANRQADLKAVHDAIVNRLLEYFHPLLGGNNGTGWPFGHDIHFGNIYREILGISGVRRVECLEVTTPHRAHLYGYLHFAHETDSVVVQTVAEGDALDPSADMVAGGGIALTASALAALATGDVLEIRDTLDASRTEYVTVQAGTGGAPPSIREPGLLFDHPLGTTKVHKVVLSDVPTDVARTLDPGEPARTPLIHLSDTEGLEPKQVVRIGSGSTREYQIIREVPRAVCDDVLEVEEGTLVHLPRTAIDVKVTYDRQG